MCQYPAGSCAHLWSPDCLLESRGQSKNWSHGKQHVQLPTCIHMSALQLLALVQRLVDAYAHVCFRCARTGIICLPLLSTRVASCRRMNVRSCRNCKYWRCEGYSRAIGRKHAARLRCPTRPQGVPRGQPVRALATDTPPIDGASPEEGGSEEEEHMHDVTVRC